jgi:hypothetical protein
VYFEVAGSVVEYVTLSYKRTLRIEVAYTNCPANSLNIFIVKTLVPSLSALFTYLSIDRKPYYNSGLSLNKSIDLTSTSL